jgi:predicted transposase YdaD
LRPFIVDYEQEVRQNISSWVEHIKNTGLKPEFENRLVEILARLIEQKFKTLSYEELEKMLKLTPFKETRSVQKVLYEDRMQLLTTQVKRKFRFADSTVNRLALRLQKLTLEDLKTLFGDIIEMNRLQEINAWIDERLANPIQANNGTNGTEKTIPDNH